MKIIDLLNKIANGEEVPEKIKLKGYDYIFTLREDCTGYRWYGEEKTHKSIGETICQNLEYVLRCEVEILDDEDEEKGLPEKITMRAGLVGDIDNKIENLDINIMAVEDKLNEIIDYLEKQSKAKGNEDER